MLPEILSRVVAGLLAHGLAEYFGLVDPACEQAERSQPLECFLLAEFDLLVGEVRQRISDRFETANAEAERTLLYRSVGVGTVVVYDSDAGRIRLRSVR